MIIREWILFMDSPGSVVETSKLWKQARGGWTGQRWLRLPSCGNRPEVVETSKLWKQARGGWDFQAVETGQRWLRLPSCGSRPEVVETSKLFDWQACLDIACYRHSACIGQWSERWQDDWPMVDLTLQGCQNAALTGCVCRGAEMWRNLSPAVGGEARG